MPLLNGIRNCQDAGIKVGLRFTINRRNAADIPQIFDLIEKENIPRICFYHLVYAGRGSALIQEDLDGAETRKGGGSNHRPNPGPTPAGKSRGSSDRGQSRRRAVFIPADEKGRFSPGRGGPGSSAHERGKQLRDRHRLRELGRRGPCGSILAPLFFRQRATAPVQRNLERMCPIPVMAKLKEKKKHVKGRCASCRWLEVCAGNFRVRAEAFDRRSLGSRSCLLPYGRGDRQWVNAAFGKEPQGMESSTGQIPTLTNDRLGGDAPVQPQLHSLPGGRGAGSLSGRIDARKKPFVSSTISSLSASPVVILTGGEPLLREDIFDLARYGTETGIAHGDGPEWNPDRWRKSLAD